MHAARPTFTSEGPLLSLHEDAAVEGLACTHTYLTRCMCNQGLDVSAQEGGFLPRMAWRPLGDNVPALLHRILSGTI